MTIKIIVSVLLAVMIAASALAPPPRGVPARAIQLTGTMPLLALITAVAWALGGRGAGAVSLAFSVAVCAAITWLLRGIDDDGRSGGETDEVSPDDGDDLRFDWDEFERQRLEHAREQARGRERELVGV